MHFSIDRTVHTTAFDKPVVATGWNGKLITKAETFNLLVFMPINYNLKYIYNIIAVELSLQGAAQNVLIKPQITYRCAKRTLQNYSQPI